MLGSMQREELHCRLQRKKQQCMHETPTKEREREGEMKEACLRAETSGITAFFLQVHGARDLEHPTVRRATGGHLVGGCHLPGLLSGRLFVEIPDQNTFKTEKDLHVSSERSSC